MGMILDFGNWRKLHEAEEAEMAMDASAGGPNPYTNLKNKPQSIKHALMSLAPGDVAGFWKLSNAVGGILKSIGPLELDQPTRFDIALHVEDILGKKYADTVAMYKKWSESTGWEKFWNAVLPDEGKPQSINNDWNNKFSMPRDTGAKWNLD